MKKIISVIAIAAFLSGCTSQTAYGPCIGVLDDKNPELVYKLSWWNTAMAVVFSETIVVPIVVVASGRALPGWGEEVIAIHIQQTDAEIVVSQLDCVIARVNKKYFPYEGDTIELLHEVLSALGHRVEVEYEEG